MKLKLFAIILAGYLAMVSIPMFANDEKARDHGHEDNAKTQTDRHEETEEPGHSDAEGDEHAEAEEAPQNVGPEKGIISFDEKEGFVLSPEALKTFAIKLQKLSGPGPWTLPKICLLETGDEKNIYRARKGVFKRIDIELVKKDSSSFTFTSKDLSDGDEVVSQGTGFVRVAELDVTSGESGHHH